MMGSSIFDADTNFISDWNAPSSLVTPSVHNETDDADD